MADNVTVGNTPGTADYAVASEELADGSQLQSVELHTELAGVKTKVGVANPLPVIGVISGAVTGPLTDAQLRATPVPVSGAVTGPLTDAQLRAAAVPVSGTVAATGPLTDAQLRATAVPVSGPLTDTQLRTTALPVSQAPVPLTASAPAAASVGVASAAALAANAARKGLVLVNRSNNTISIAFGAPAVLDSGISLDPGGSFTMTRETFTTAEVRAIAGGAASALAIQEFTT